MKFLVFILTLVGSLLIFVFTQSTKHEAKNDVFRSKCEDRGGVTIVDRNQGLSIPHCFAKEAVIDIRESND